MAYNVANVEVVLGVADGGGPRGAEPPRGALERSEAKRKGPPRGLHGKPVRPPPPLRTPTYRNWGVRGAARPPGCKPAPGVVWGPVRG
jgi:hypothetical protein